MRVRTVLLALSLLAGLVGWTPARVDATEPDRRPDILMIMVDDLPGIDDRILWRLPNIRSTFLRNGVRFTDAHGETPLCCPGRAGFLTGLHTHHHGVYVNTVRHFEPGMTIATQLQGVGYETMLVGKYFNLYDRFAPTVPPGWDHFHALVPGSTSAAGYYDYDFWNDGKATPKHYGRRDRDYSTDVIRKKVLTHLRSDSSGSPRFGLITPYAPHGPTLPAPRHRTHAGCSRVATWAPPNYDEEDVSDKPAYVREARRLGDSGYDLRGFCRAMLAVDDLVGAVRAELASQGRLDDTVLILTSDNGMNLGAHRLHRKSTPYSTRIPLLVSWPARLGTTARRIGEPVSNIDLAPTLCAIAGCTLGPYPDGPDRPDGRSFLRLLTGKAPSMPRRHLLISSPVGNAKLDMPGWHGLRTTWRSPSAWSDCADAGTGQCRWQYVRYESDEEELYDLSNGPCWTWSKGESGDPCALQNLAADPAFEGLRQTLAKRLDRMLAGPS